MNPGTVPILCPYGQPRDEADRKALTAFMIYCGGDLSRMLDAPADSIEHFVNYHRRLQLDDAPGRRPIVVLTDVSDLELKILRARDQLCDTFPCLIRSLWILFVSHASKNLFMGRTSHVGEAPFDRQEAHVWTSNSGAPYLVLTATYQDIKILRDQVRDLLEAAEKPRRRRSSQAQMAAVVPSSIKKP